MRVSQTTTKSIPGKLCFPGTFFLTYTDASSLIPVAQLLGPLKDTLHDRPRPHCISIVQHFHGIRQRTAQRTEFQFVIRHKTIFFHSASCLTEYRIFSVEITSFTAAAYFFRQHLRAQPHIISAVFAYPDLTNTCGKDDAHGKPLSLFSSPAAVSL